MLFSVICLGFSALASQIVFIREFLIAFSGDELSIGIILASWMLGGAIGSLFLKGIADKLKQKNLTFTLLQIFLSLLLAPGILLIRLIRPVLGVNPGQILPFYILVIFCFLILIPLCSILSFMFVLSCRIYGTKVSGISRVYTMEALGSMLGGTIASLMLIRFFNSFEIMAVLSLLNAIAAFIFTASPQKKMVRLAAVLIMLLSAFLWLSGGWKKIEVFSFKKQWPGYAVLDARNSIYANLVTLKRGEQISFFNNGTRLYSVPDKQAREEAAHFCLLEHREPKDILLIGGGMAGLLDEILKHPVERIDYLELDPELIKIAQNFLAPVHTSALKNPKVFIKNLDGRYFIKTTGNKYDCIIVNLGDPYTAQLNRFYTREFFHEAKRVLKERGIISFGLSSSESYINFDLARYLGSVYAALQKEFTEVKVIPGNTAYFLATDTRGGLTYDYKLLMHRAAERKLDLQYVREYYLFSKLTKDKIYYTENALKKARPRFNFDFRPSSYYYAIIYWSSQFRDSLITDALRKVSGGAIWLIFSLSVISLSLFGFKNKVDFSKIALAGICAAGFSQAAIQIAILFSFQIIYGYLYFKLGLLFTFFMLGLAIGGWLTGRPGRPGRPCLPAGRQDLGDDRLRRKFMFFQLSIAIYAFLFPAAVTLLSLAKPNYAYWFGANIFFPALSFLSGLQGGALFVLANKAYLNKEKGAGASAGLTYGLDLLGSCAGAILTAVFMIPVLGLAQTCLIIGLLNSMMVWLLL
ncbi:MAG: fused MFS/spermidine synthase [Candidatus Omnitrophota bacterium]|nr:fused MFS/spermidine synthase [Candidatus Omnitrophota bacterium]